MPEFDLAGNCAYFSGKNTTASGRAPYHNQRSYPPRCLPQGRLQSRRAFVSPNLVMANERRNPERHREAMEILVRGFFSGNGDVRRSSGVLSSVGLREEEGVIYRRAWGVSLLLLLLHSTFFHYNRIYCFDRAPAPVYPEPCEPEQPEP